MKALILAAGFGSRLKRKTADLPKALVPINGRPILSYQLGTLLANSINEVVMVVGYKGDKIIDYVSKSFPQIKAQYIWNREYERSNSSYSFWLAKELIKNEPYLHLNCDVIFSSSLLNKVIQSRYNNVIAIRKDILLGDQMENVELNGDKITKMSITNTPNSVGKAFGLAKLGPESTNFIAERIRYYLERGDKNQNYYGIIREAINYVDYYAIDAGKDLLLEVNTLTDLSKVEKTMRGLK